MLKGGLMIAFSILSHLHFNAVVTWEGYWSGDCAHIHLKAPTDLKMLEMSAEGTEMKLETKKLMRFGLSISAVMYAYRNLKCPFSEVC